MCVYACFLFFFFFSPKILAAREMKAYDENSRGTRNSVISFITLHFCYVNVIYGEGLRGTQERNLCALKSVSIINFLRNHHDT